MDRNRLFREIPKVDILLDRAEIQSDIISAAKVLRNMAIPKSTRKKRLMIPDAGNFMPPITIT